MKKEHLLIVVDVKLCSWISGTSGLKSDGDEIFTKDSRENRVT